MPRGVSHFQEEPVMPSVLELDCPNCAAPLHPREGQPLVICLYCGSSARILAEGARPQAVLQTTLAAEGWDELRRLLTDGRQEEAVKLYQARTQADPAEARSAVDNLARQLSVETITRQPLSPFGVVLSGLAALLLVLSLAGWALGRLGPWLALALAAAAGFQLLAFRHAIAVTLRYLGAPVAPATILKLAPVGEVRVRDQHVKTFKMLVEVRPKSGAPFTTELLQPVRAQSLAKAQPGRQFWVKYRPGDPSSVVFHRAGS
jgi:hypothetical protein